MLTQQAYNFLWIPKHGHAQVFRPYKIFINQLAFGTGMQINYLKNAMKEQFGDRESISVNSPDPVR